MKSFRNSTALDGERLRLMLLRHTAPYRHDKLQVSVRYSRGAAFSGTCYSREARIFVNLGRQVAYPYSLATNIAKSYSNKTHWWRDTYSIVLTDAYQLALFVYLHELYHYLVKLAGRSPRRKEARCDRFAARTLVDYHGCRILDSHGRIPARETWDFQDLDAFVTKAPRQVMKPPPPKPGERQIPVTIYG
ncbi:MAG: hypothetical protein ABIG44_16915 [Planctomycetota bacterium]